MGLSMAERKAVTKQMVKRYKKAGKSEKGTMLDELCALTGWTRRHARRALTQAKNQPSPPPRRERPRIYGPEVLEALRFVWATLNGPAGKRLAPFMADAVEALERHGKLNLDHEVRSKLLQMSSARIDRALSDERRRLRVKGRSGTKPGSILKRRSPSGPLPSGMRSCRGSARLTWWATMAAHRMVSSARPSISYVLQRVGPR